MTDVEPIYGKRRRRRSSSSSSSVIICSTATGSASSSDSSQSGNSEDECFGRKIGGPLLQKKFTRAEQTFLGHKSSMGIHNDTTLTSLKQLALLAYQLELKHRPQPWANFLYLLKRSLRESEEIYDTAQYILNEITSVFLNENKKARCIQIYETMLVAVHGTGVQLTHVLNHLSWCLYLSREFEECSDILLSMEVKNSFDHIQFSDIYHTALCLKKENVSKPLEKWEKYLKNRALNSEAEKEDDRATLSCVAEIAKHVVEGKSGDVIRMVTRVYDLVLEGFNSRMGYESEFSKKARDEKLKLLETLEHSDSD